MSTFVRQAYNYDVDEASLDVGLTCGPSLSKQSFKEECDINTILRRFGLGAQLPTGVRMPTYGDFTQLVDYHQALNAVAVANEAFDTLPALVRKRFNNDPGAFVDFCSDEANRAEAEKLGMVQPKLDQLVKDAAVATSAEPGSARVESDKK